METLAALLCAIAGLGCPSSSAPPRAIGGVDDADTTVAVARPADDIAHPGSTTEWWYVHAIDPKTGRAVIVSIFAEPQKAIGGFLYEPSGVKTWRALASAASTPHTGPGYSVKGSSIRYDVADKAWIIVSDSSGYRVRLKLSATRPGATAGPLRYGRESMSWTVPVATSRADGSITTPDGRTIEIRDWRGYHDHNWGPFSLQSRDYGGWEWAAVHEGPGKAWVLGGLTDKAGRFAGVLTRVERTRVTTCRPTVRLERWTKKDGFRFPSRVTATCRGRKSVRFTVTRPFVASLVTHALTESIGTSQAPGSLGFVEHMAPMEAG